MKKKIFIDSKLQICDKSFQKTPQGFLLLEGIASRSGAQQYLDSELGIGSSGKLVTLHRPVEEVTDPISVASFINMPIADEHPAEGEINSKNFSRYNKGTVLDANPTPSGQVKVSMLVNDFDLINKIENGKRELSAGYSAELEFSDDGESAIQRKIRGNHVAFVDAARCGKECSIFDSKPTTGEHTMAKMKINGVEYDIADSVAPAVQILIDQNSDLTDKVQTLTDSNEKTQAMLDASNEKVKKMEDEEEDEDEKKKKIGDAAHELLSVLQDASYIIADYDAEGKSAVEIKRDVVCEAKPDLAEKSNAYIEASFDIIVADAKKEGGDPLSKAFRHQANDSDAKLTDSQKARKTAIEKKKNAWKGGNK